VSDVKLKDCPFCGRPGAIDSADVGGVEKWIAWCSAEDASDSEGCPIYPYTGWEFYKQDAIRLWNHRADSGWVAVGDRTWLVCTTRI
jgi:hypothetical protein